MCAKCILKSQSPKIGKCIKTLNMHTLNTFQNRSTYLLGLSRLLLSRLACLSGDLYDLQLFSSFISAIASGALTLGPTEHSPGPSVCLSVWLQSVLWQNGQLDPDAIWGGEWGHPRHSCINGVHVTQGDGAVLEIFLHRNVFDSCLPLWLSGSNH